jgi:hypothetical protein
MYDARSWVLGVAAHRIRGTNEDTGEGLYSIPADRLNKTQLLIRVGTKLAGREPSSERRRYSDVVSGSWCTAGSGVSSGRIVVAVKAR